MKKKKLVVIAIVALACIAAIIAVVWKNAPVQKQKKQLELGNRYLEEMNYEQAKVVFEELITIDPSNVEAYLGAAKAHAGLEDYEGAVAVLQEGYKQTSSEDIKMLLEEYEQKLEEQKAEAEQALREEIKEYMKTIPVTTEIANKNPIYTYSYLKKIYPEMEAKLQEYLKKTTDEGLKASIYLRLNLMELSVNDMEKAREYHELSGVGETETTDEYGRNISVDGEGWSAEYSYYEGSSRLKTYVTSRVDDKGKTRIQEYEYSDYDIEGRVLSETITDKGTYIEAEFGGNLEDYRGYPGCLFQVVTTYSYEGDKSYSWGEGKSICGQGSNGTDKWVELYDINYERIDTYDENGYLILAEYYNKTENSRDKTIYDAGHPILSESYDEAGNLRRKVEYDTEGNVISDTTY